MKDSKKYNEQYYHFDSLLSKKLQNKLSNIKSLLSPYTKKAYIVGGAIRDYLLQQEINDLDIEVFGIDIDTLDMLMQKIGANGIGKSFFVYKYDNCIDISLPRLENKTSYGHRGFDVKLAHTEYDATIRRDFTINAMMINIYTNELLDYHSGINDLQSKTLKIINENKFKEDSLRVLRCMQFASRLRFKVDKQSIYIMQQISIKDLSKERVYTEFEKMFLSQHLEYGFYYMIKLNIFKQLFDYDVSYSEYISITRLLIRYKTYFDKDNYKYYFVYILAQKLSISMDILCNVLNLPNEYKKILKKQIPLTNNISTRELYILSLDNPIKDYLTNLYPNIQNLAKQLSIYDTKLQTPVNANDVISDGYKGKDISIQIRKKEIEYIDSIC